MAYDYIFSPDINYQNSALSFAARQELSLPRAWIMRWGCDVGASYIGGADCYYLNSERKRESSLDGSEQRLYDLGMGGNL
ncbi:MAG: hypothetical protein J6I73_09725 [Treponema sp.]|nr:hypothetical protein [Treponema sp.]